MSHHLVGKLANLERRQICTSGERLHVDRVSDIGQHFWSEHDVDQQRADGMITVEDPVCAHHRNRHDRGS